MKMSASITSLDSASFVRCVVQNMRTRYVQINLVKYINAAQDTQENASTFENITDVNLAAFAFTVMKSRLFFRMNNWKII